MNDNDYRKPEARATRTTSGEVAITLRTTAVIDKGHRRWRLSADGDGATVENVQIEDAYAKIAISLPADAAYALAQLILGWKR